jgi:hypothetical protein
MPVPTEQALDPWRRRRSRLRWRWWVYLSIAIVGAVVFVRNFRTPDPINFAIFLLIPLLALRQAWKTDRQIALCDRRLREPIIESKENFHE